MGFPPPSGGSSAVLPAFVAGSNGGDITTASASFVDVTGMAVSIAAVAGDKLLLVSKAGITNTVLGAATVLRAVTTTGGNVIDRNNVQTPAATDLTTQALAAVYTVVSGDISGGNVAVKLQWLVGGGTGTIANSSGNIPTLALVNLLH